MKFQRIFNSLKIDSGDIRRKELIDEMLQNEDAGYDCLKCSGMCCSYQANSMHITSLEALEILIKLESIDKLENLKDVLLNNIDEFRLDKVLLTSRGNSFRRSYTCPFFKEGLGCFIGKSLKPYGCIAFNPRKKEQANGGECLSNLLTQEKREKYFYEQEFKANEDLKRKYGIDLLKKSIPEKVLEVFEKTL